MADASYFRKKAQRCRELLKVAIAPEVREQLRIWVEEFETRARCLPEQSRHSANGAIHPGLARARRATRGN